MTIQKSGDREHRLRNLQVEELVLDLKIYSTKTSILSGSQVFREVESLSSYGENLKTKLNSLALEVFKFGKLVEKL